MREGGHNIPAALIAQRYTNGLSLLKQHYRAFDRLQLYDNTSSLREVLDLAPGQPMTIAVDVPDWAVPVIAHIKRVEELYSRLD